MEDEGVAVGRELFVRHKEVLTHEQSQGSFFVGPSFRCFKEYFLEIIGETVPQTSILLIFFGDS